MIRKILRIFCKLIMFLIFLISIPFSIIMFIFCLPVSFVVVFSQEDGTLRDVVESTLSFAFCIQEQLLEDIND